MRTNVLRALSFAAGLAAIPICVFLGCSSKSNNNNQGNDAKQSFVNNVYPLINPTCSKCHSTGLNGAPIFLASTADGSYNAIEGTPGLIAPPESSPIVQKGIHSGPALTTDEVTAVTNWLNLEVKDRGILATGKPANIWAAFSQFGACMDYNRWLALKLDTIAQQPTDGNQGQCMSCHNRGQANNWLSADAADTFNHFTKFPFVERLVVGSVDDKGAFAGLVKSDRLVQKGIEERQANANSHPTYTLLTPLAMGIDQFVSETISNMNAQACSMVAKPDAGPEGGDGGP
jgi:hypothetical protein